MVSALQLQSATIRGMFEGLLQPVHLLVILILVISIVIGISYLLTLRKALERCDRQSRTTSPDSVWLMLIPLFSFVYQFILVDDIGKSLAREYARRGLASEEREPGWALGIAMGVLHIAGWIARLLIDLPGLRGLIVSVVSLAGLACWILYWIKIADYSSGIAYPFEPVQQPQSFR